MKKIIYILFTILCTPYAYTQWNTDRIISIGQNALYNKDYLLAIQYYNQAIKIKPYLAEPYIYRAIAKTYLEDYIGAEKDCNIAIERNPFIPQAYYTRGFIKTQVGKPQEAIQNFDKALEFSPENPLIILNRAIAKEKDKQYQNAIDDLKKYQKLEPNENNEINYEIGRIHLLQKDTIKALQAIDQFILTDTTNPIGYSTKALIKIQQNDTKNALYNYKKAIENHSQYIGDYINRGILNTQNNNFTDALKDYSKAIQIDSNNTLAYYNRGLLRAKLGDNNNAIQDLQKVLQTDSLNYEARLQNAVLQLQVGELQNAEKNFNIILKKYPFYAPAYIGIAEAKEKQGKMKEGIKYRQTATEILNNKDYYKQKQLIANNKINKHINTKQTIISQKLISNIEKRKQKTNDNKTDNNIQNQPTDITPQKDYNISYYQSPQQNTQTNDYHPIIAKQNNTSNHIANIHITNHTIALSPDIIAYHFERIQQLTQQIQKTPNTTMYYKRALQLATVKDFQSAIEDIENAISIDSTFSLGYFTRAYITHTILQQPQTNTIIESKANTIQKIIQDYQKTIQLTPDFTFAYYNLGNIYLEKKQYQQAIEQYQQAIKIDPDFAEAYYNMGLIFIVENDLEKAQKNLSKAGELGIANAYSLLKNIL